MYSRTKNWLNALQVEDRSFTWETSGSISGSDKRRLFACQDFTVSYFLPPHSYAGRDSHLVKSVFSALFSSQAWIKGLGKPLDDVGLHIWAKDCCWKGDCEFPCEKLVWNRPWKVSWYWSLCMGHNINRFTLTGHFFPPSLPSFRPPSLPSFRPSSLLPSLLFSPASFHLLAM